MSEGSIRKHICPPIQHQSASAVTFIPLLQWSRIVVCSRLAVWRSHELPQRMGAWIEWQVTSSFIPGASRENQAFHLCSVGAASISKAPAGKFFSKPIWYGLHSVYFELHSLSGQNTIGVYSLKGEFGEQSRPNSRFGKWAKWENFSGSIIVA